MRVYKYIGLGSQYGVRNCEALLRHSQLWVSDYRKLNDPFEFRFILDNEVVGSKRDFVIAVQKSSNGVISFSQLNNDLLLWSHYGSCHRGICFEFESEADETLNSIKPINYLPTMPTYDASKPDEMLYAKSQDWKYEAEARVIVPNVRDTYFSFKPECLKGVYFGFKVTIEDVKQFDPLCDERGVPRYQVETVKNDYRVSFKAIQNINQYFALKRDSRLKELVKGVFRRSIVQKIINKRGE